MSSFVKTLSLKEEVRRFIVRLEVFNEHGESMPLFKADISGRVIEGETNYWSGETTNLCHSEGLEAAVFALEVALVQAKKP